MRRPGNRAAAVLLICMLVGVGACGTQGASSLPASIAATRTPSPTPPRATAAAPAPPTAPPSRTPAPSVVVAAGDIATCDAETDEETAALAAAIVAERDATIVTLGDHAYPDGTAAQFEQCYGPSWGRLADRTHPVLGNHDYHTDRAGPYFAYFGADAGTPGEGWYSVDIGEWHVVALNSNCELVGCDADSPQGRWLADDLAASDARCTLALLHHPRWSSGPEGDQAKVGELWWILHAGGADVALSGHAHQYERLAPLDATGAVDEERGVRQFVVGTGGRSLYAFGAINPGSEIRSNASFGVLQLVLHPDGYDWEFLPVDAGGFTDAGSGSCH